MKQSERFRGGKTLISHWFNISQIIFYKLIWSLFFFFLMQNLILKRNYRCQINVELKAEWSIE